jgi:hypothetical protein
MKLPSLARQSIFAAPATLWFWIGPIDSAELVVGSFSYP